MEFSSTTSYVVISYAWIETIAIQSIVNISNSLFPFGFPEHTGVIFILYVPGDRFLNCSGEVPKMFKNN